MLLPIPRLTVVNQKRVAVGEKQGDAIAQLPKPLPGPQSAYVESKADICIYGGAAGGGKTMGTLIDFARPEFLKLSGYGAVIFRRTCPQITNEGALILAERLRTKIQRELSISLNDLKVINGINILEAKHNVTVSIGVSCIKDEFEDPIELLKYADRALYSAKNEGRNRVVPNCG